MKKIILVLRISFLFVGVFLLSGAMGLKTLLILDLSSDVFFDYLSKLENVYYSIIPYDINVLIFFCVPIIDIAIVYKVINSMRPKKFYWIIALVVYTTFFLVRLGTLQS